MPSPRRVALVIGNSAYRSVARLPNPANDAQLIGDALRAAGIDDVTVAVDLDRAGMVGTLRAFARKADNSDWAMVYYAGHGMEMDGQNYLIPVDASLETDRDIPDETLSLDRVLSAVSGARHAQARHPRRLPEQSVRFADEGHRGKPGRDSRPVARRAG